RIYQTSRERSLRRVLCAWDADVGPSMSSVRSDSARGLDMSSTSGFSVFAGLSEGFPMTSFGETLTLVGANSLAGEYLEGGAFGASMAIARVFLAGTTSGLTSECGCCAGEVGVAVEHVAG